MCSRIPELLSFERKNNGKNTSSHNKQQLTPRIVSFSTTDNNFDWRGPVISKKRIVESKVSKPPCLSRMKVKKSSVLAKFDEILVATKETVRGSTLRLKI